MRVGEVLLVMRDAPFGMDAATARHNARNAILGERHEWQPHPGVDGHVIHPLLGLLDERVAEDLPGEVFSDAADLLQRLIDGHGANGHGRVADDPFTRGVDVLARRQIHDGVGTPAGRPDHFLDFLGDVRRNRRVADISVDLHLEAAADDHRLDLRVVDVRGDDGTATRHFVAHEFGGDGGTTGAAFILANGDVFHLRRDDAATRIMHLRHVHARFGAQRRFDGARELRHFHFLVFTIAVILGAHGAADVMLHIATAGDPLAAQFGQPGIDVHGVILVGVGTGRVIDRQRLLAGFLGKHDLALRHFHPHQPFAARHVLLAAAGERAGGDIDRGFGFQGSIAGGRGHGESFSCHPCAGRDLRSRAL